MSEASKYRRRLAGSHAAQQAGGTPAVRRVTFEKAEA